MSAFQTKDFVSIVTSMINWMKAIQTKITDFRIGSVVRTLLEAAAVEIDQLYQQMANGLIQAIPASLYLAFGFDKLGALKANGIVTFSIPAPVGTNTPIVQGTTVTNADGSKAYITLALATILAGQTTVNADIQATVAGTVDNCGAGDINKVVGGPPTVTVSNASPIVSGRDAETDDQRRLRFIQYIAALSRGPLLSLEYGAETAQLVDGAGVVTERVVEAVAMETYLIRPSEPLGHVNVYIYNGGSGASGPLVTLAQQIIDGYVDGSGAHIPGYKAAGVRAAVAAVTLQSVNVTMRVRVTNNVLTSDQQTRMTENIQDVFAKNPNSSALRLSQLAAACTSVTGCIDATPLVPANDIAGIAGTKFTAGTITFQVAPA